MTQPPPLPPPHPPWWQWINWLALDAVAVALAWLPVFAAMTGARLTPINYTVLGAAVWIVYLLDRLLDGSSGQGTAARHAFARRRALWLLPLMAAVALSALWAALHHLRGVTLHAGVNLAGAVLLYFAIVGATRWKPLRQLLLLLLGLALTALLVSTGLALALLPDDFSGPSPFLIWQALAAAALLTLLFRKPAQPAPPRPWILLKKAFGGYLFALGVALAPFAHLQDWDGLLRGTPVLLFAATCAANSLGIRLWEDPQHPQVRSLAPLYPWLLAALAAAAAFSLPQADAWSRPLLGGVAACALGFAALHALRHRFPPGAATLAADGWMVAVALILQHLAPTPPH